MKSAPIPTYLAHLKQEGKRPKTITVYGKVLFRLQEENSDPISDLFYEEILRYLGSIKGRGAWRNTVAIILRNYYTWLINQGHRNDNPLQHINIKAPKQREYPVMSAEEIDKIFQHAKPKIQGLIYHLQWTGVRISEAIGSKKEDFLLDKVDSDGNPAPEMLVRGKGGTNTYLPLLNPKHVSWLKKRLFSKRTGERLFPLSYHQAWYGIHVAAKRAGVQKMIYNEDGQHCYYVHPHAFRHYFATWASRAGFEITLIQRLVLHKNITTTMRYIKINNDSIRSRAKELFVASG